MRPKIAALLEELSKYKASELIPSPDTQDVLEHTTAQAVDINRENV